MSVFARRSDGAPIQIQSKSSAWQASLDDDRGQQHHNGDGDKGAAFANRPRPAASASCSSRNMTTSEGGA
jgi:hypothetical protein